MAVTYRTKCFVSLAARTLLVTSLLVTLAGGAEAGPRQLPRRTPPASAQLNLTYSETMCAAGGIFVYNRAVERDQGYAISQVLHASREYDRRNGVAATIAEFHDTLIYAVFTDVGYTPT